VYWILTIICIKYTIKTTSIHYYIKIIFLFTIIQNIYIFKNNIFIFKFWFHLINYSTRIIYTNNNRRFEFLQKFKLERISTTKNTNIRIFKQIFVLNNIIVHVFIVPWVVTPFIICKMLITFIPKVTFTELFSCYFVCRLIIKIFQKFFIFHCFM